MTTESGRALIRDVLGPLLSDTISGSGFVFRRSNATFNRRVNGARQTIHLGPDIEPTYSAGDLAVLQPTLRIEFDALTPYLARDDVRGSGAAILQPVAYGGDLKQWVIPTASDAPTVAKSLGFELRHRTIPLLDDLVSPAALVEAYQARDSRVMWHEQTYAAVITALALAGDQMRALDVARERFLAHGIEGMFPRVHALLEAT